MQYLLDFIQEHTLEPELRIVAHCPGQELECLWRRQVNAEHWQLRPRHSEAAWQPVKRTELIAELESRGVDMVAVRREVNALLAAQIALADAVLRDANQQLGRELVQRFARGQKSFLEALQNVIEQLSAASPPRLGAVTGGEARTTQRAGHLSIVR